MMTNNMFMKIIYQKRWLIFWWFVALVGTGLSTTVLFPAFKGSNIGQVFNSLPTSVQHIAGTASGFNSIGNYISQEVFGLRAPLLTIVLSIVVFNSLTVNEERQGILETQISLPLSRSKIFLSKLIAGILIICIASAGLFVGVELALFFIHDHYSATKLLELVLNSAVFGIIFGLVLFMLNAVFGIRGIVLGLSCAYAFISYLLTSFALTQKNLQTFDKGSLFHYYSSTGNFYIHDLLTLIYIGLGLIFISYIFFTKRDIET
jgi:ABC-type transport system involved in multi-copper enzyme maturation permease subunit